MMCGRANHCENPCSSILEAEWQWAPWAPWLLGTFTEVTFGSCCSTSIMGFSKICFSYWYSTNRYQSICFCPLECCQLQRTALRKYVTACRNRLASHRVRLSTLSVGVTRLSHQGSSVLPSTNAPLSCGAKRSPGTQMVTCQPADSIPHPLLIAFVTGLSSSNERPGSCKRPSSFKQTIQCHCCVLTDNYDRNNNTFREGFADSLAITPHSPRGLWDNRLVMAYLKNGWTTNTSASAP